MEPLKRIFLVIAVVFCGMIAFGSSLQSINSDEQSPEIRAILKKATDYEFEKDFAAAAKCYDELAEKQKSPDLAAKFYLREGEAWMQANKSRKACGIYTMLLKCYLFHIPVEGVMENLRILANNYEIGKGTLWSMEDPAGAIDIYRQIIKYQPSIEFSLDDRLVLSEKLERATEYQEAVSVLQEAVKLAPENPDVRLALAKLLLKLSRQSDGDGVRARNAIREAKSFLMYASSNDLRRAEAQRIMDDSRNLEASRVLIMATFYLNQYHYRPAVARRYLHDILRDYPNSDSAGKAKEILDAGIPDTPPKKPFFSFK